MNGIDITKQVCDSLYGLIVNSVWHPVRAISRDSMDRPVYYSVSYSVWDSVDNAIWSTTYDVLTTEIEEYDWK